MEIACLPGRRDKPGDGRGALQTRGAQCLSELPAAMFSGRRETHAREPGGLPADGLSHESWEHRTASIRSDPVQSAGLLRPFAIGAVTLTAGPSFSSSACKVTSRTAFLPEDLWVFFGF